MRSLQIVLVCCRIGEFIEAIGHGKECDKFLEVIVIG